MCEQMPHEEHVWRLPHGLTLTMLHSMYEKDFSSRINIGTGRAEQTYKYSAFCSVFKKEFPDVKKGKHTLLSQCDECAAFKDPATRKLSPELYQQAREKYIKHLKLQCLLRQLYANRCEMARLPTSLTWTVVIDFASSRGKYSSQPTHQSNDNRLCW
jgi:hypothetical protein